jgi:hypothetical protein
MLDIIPIFVNHNVLETGCFLILSCHLKKETEPVFETWRKKTGGIDSIQNNS